MLARLSPAACGYSPPFLFFFKHAQRAIPKMVETGMLPHDDMSSPSTYKGGGHAVQVATILW